MAPEDNPMDDVQPTKEEWEAYEARRQAIRPHSVTACPECDDVENLCCPSCDGTDEYCPICRIPAMHCEFGGRDDDGCDDE